MQKLCTLSGAHIIDSGARTSTHRLVLAIYLWKKYAVTQLITFGRKSPRVRGTPAEPLPNPCQEGAEFLRALCWTFDCAEPMFINRFQ